MWCVLLRPATCVLPTLLGNAICLGLLWKYQTLQQQGAHCTQRLLAAVARLHLAQPTFLRLGGAPAGPRGVPASYAAMLRNHAPDIRCTACIVLRLTEFNLSHGGTGHSELP